MPNYGDGKPIPMATLNKWFMSLIHWLRILDDGVLVIAWTDGLRAHSISTADSDEPGPVIELLRKTARELEIGTYREEEKPK